MPATRTQAKDDITARLLAALAGDSITQDLEVRWDDVNNEPADGEGAAAAAPAGQPWARAGFRHDPGTKTSLGSPVNKSRWTESGTFWMQLFTPGGDGFKLSDQIVQVILNGFRSGGQTPNGIQFRSSGAVEGPRDGSWSSALITVDFEYDQYA